MRNWCFTTLCIVVVFLWVSVPLALADAGTGDAAGAAYLWTIGIPDGALNEFALAPGGFREFSQDGFYYVGVSDAGRDWPYAHPGPRDGWAGNRPHTFTILFALKQAPPSGDCRLECSVADAQSDLPPTVRFEINGHPFERKLEAGVSDSFIEGAGGAHTVEQITVPFPSNLLHEGENRIAITTLTGSWFLYDWVGLAVPPGTSLSDQVTARTAIESAEPLPVLYASQDGPEKQGLRLSVRHFGEPCQAAVRVGDDAPVDVDLEHGIQEVEARHTAVTGETPATVQLLIEGKVAAERDAVLKPVRKWSIYLLHHTHLDIGYTHAQSEVEAIQWRHLETAMDLIEQTAEYPEGSRFKWLPEGLWAVDSYLQQASEENRRRFVEAVRQGGIGLDALYGNELTALCRPEELFKLTGYARELARTHGLTIDSAMISDVPGYTWGLVPSLAQNGVHFISIGPNSGHRIGHTLTAWGDRPFYWVSPSGDEKILFWMAGRGYSWFHRGPLRDGRQLLDYLDELERSGYSYDMVQVRYNIGGDNGPPDPELCDFVKDWNTRYVFPKLIIATTSETFHAFESAYGDSIPEMRGDFTPYWEDGAASSALETIVNRASAERLVQAETLWSLIDPAAYPAKAFAEAWRNVLLYDEHTWGAHNSISQPESEFALQQWTVKQAFAMDGEQQSQELLHDTLNAFTNGDIDTATAVLVWNTLPWPRTDLVVLSGTTPRAGDRIADDKGNPVPSQRLANGDLAFLAKHVPAMGASRYTLHDGEPYQEGACRVEGNTLSNRVISLALDEKTGAIQSLTHQDYSGDFVDTTNETGLNGYIYVPGRDPKVSERIETVSIRIGEPGPLVASLVVESQAPGCRSLTREVQLVTGLDRVDLVTTLDKEKVYEKEAVHLAFPFNVPGATVRMDTPWAVVRPETDQLPGACKNYFTVQRWVDVSGEATGITWTTIDAPLVEVGAITCDARVVGWLEQVEPSATLYSYVMNNYWETNYKAAQEGPTVFRYSIRPHGVFDQGQAQCFGVKRGQPLLVVPDRSGNDSIASRLRVSPQGVMVTSIRPSRDGSAWLIRLFNGSASATKAELDWPSGKPDALWQSNFDEEPLKKMTGPIPMAPYAIVTLRADKPPVLPLKEGTAP